MIHDGFMGGMWFSWIFWGVVKFANNNSNRGVDANTPQGPLDVLKNRQAKGEISKEKFEEIKKDLLNG